MVAIGKLNGRLTQDDRSLYMKGWESWKAAPTSLVDKHPDNGVLMPFGHDQNFFSKLFGNAAAAAIYGELDTSLNSTGKYISKAYNTKVAMNEIFNPTPGTPEARIYSAFKKEMKRRGGKSWEIIGYGSGTDRGEIALSLIHGDSTGYLLFNKDISKKVKEGAAMHEVSEKGYRGNLHLHEPIHYYLIRGGTPEAEKSLEKILASFARKQMKDISRGFAYDEKEKTRLVSYLREIAEISECRAETAHITYRDYKSTAYSSKQLQQMAGKYMSKAKELGYETRSAQMGYALKEVKKEVAKKKNSKKKKAAKKKAAKKAA